MGAASFLTWRRLSSYCPASLREEREMGLGGIDTSDGIKVGIRRCACHYPDLLQQNGTS